MAAQELQFHDYWRIIYRRRYVLFFFFITVLGTAITFSLLKEPVYRTYTRVQIVTAQQSSIEGVTLSMRYMDPWTMVNTEVKAITNLTLAEVTGRILNDIKKDDSANTSMQIASTILAQISSQRESDSNIIRIVATGADPYHIADLVNTYTQTYIDHKMKEKIKFTREMRRFLESQLVEAERKLKESENALKRFKEKFRGYGTSATIAKKINDLKIQNEQLHKKYTSRHPEVQKITSQIRFYEKKLKTLPSQEQDISELKRSVRLNESDYINLSNKHKKALVTEANTTQNVFWISRAEVPVKPISPNHKTNATAGGILGLVIGLIFVFIFENLDTSIGTIEEVEEYMKLPVLGVIPHIDLPHKEQSTVWKRFKNRFFSSKFKRLPVDPRTLIIFHSKKSHFAESYHTLRTNIKFTALGTHGKSLLFTSAGTDEGKTVTTTNFALAASMVGIKTLLVEADLRRPVISQLFGLPRKEGLSDLILGNAHWPDPVVGMSDLLMGKLGIENLINNPSIENLKILSGGSIHANPVDILNSPEFDRALQQFKDEFELVVFDCSPTLLFADSIILGKKVDAVVLVYQVGKMARGALKRAKAQLEGLKASVKGVVLNDLRAADMGPQYGYYYYDYNYSKYYADESENKKKNKFAV